MTSAARSCQVSGDVWDTTPIELARVLRSLNWTTRGSEDEVIATHEGTILELYECRRTTKGLDFLVSGFVTGTVDEARRLLEALGGALERAGLIYHFELEDESEPEGTRVIEHPTLRAHAAMSRGDSAACVDRSPGAEYGQMPQVLQPVQGWCDRLAGAASTEGEALAAALGVTARPEATYLVAQAPPEGATKATIVGGAPGLAHVELVLAEPLARRDFEAAFGAGQVLPRTRPEVPHTIRYTVPGSATRWGVSVLARAGGTEPDARVERVTLRLEERVAPSSELAERSKRLAQQLLEALDQPEDPDRIAYEVQKDREDREALDRFYVATGQKPASAAPPEVLAALWDYARTPDAAFVLAGLSDAGLRRFEVTPVPAAKRAATLAAMRRRGVVVGGCYGGAGFAWVIGPELGVWSTSARLASGTRDELVLASGRVRRHELDAVAVSISDDYVERAVVLALADGRTVAVASERDAVAELDPTYGRAELLVSDAWWTVWLARELATWLHVPLRDDVFGASVELSVVTAVHELATKLEASPATGAAAAIDVRFALHGQQAILRATAAEPDGRTVELALGARTQRLAGGSRDELVAFLRWPACADDVARAARDLR